MNEIFSRTSSAAVMMAGKPDQIQAVLAGWMAQYGRDMPLVYILSLQAEHRSRPCKAG
ncbi:hypothetical protein GCM10010912_21860 [Paenibacillus albidus]|uniref:Uncharacterized protein n=1 Tax=Paenibacillus albidus TaxID=2041023 RepID=A0A917C883_9BACL|nr:hypothetical protein [Paenibacillus albidus]GGF76374.1 hypothetical protein GCM10010912_21860 [Paenibacillus albidus]